MQPYSRSVYSCLPIEWCHAIPLIEVCVVWLSVKWGGTADGIPPTLALGLCANWYRAF